MGITTNLTQNFAILLYCEGTSCRGCLAQYGIYYLQNKNMSPDAWRAAGTYFTFGKHQIFYIEEGSGPVLVLIHGFPTASWDWVPIWEELTTSYRVIAPDMLGFGFSDKPRPYQYTIAEQADLHEVLLDQLSIKEAHLLVHDYGVSVGQELLARELEGSIRFTPLSCCFLNGGLFPGTYRPRLIQRILMSPIGPWLSPFLGRANLAKTFSEIFGPDTQPSEAEIDNFWSLIAYNNGKEVIPRIIRYMQERIDFEERWAKNLPNTKVPIRLINGAMDPISGRHVADYYRQVIPNPDVVVLDRIGHYPQVEAPEEVLFHFRAFQERV